jgi:excisionase family DNA binding protein
MNKPEIMTAEQVAEWLQVDISHVQRLARKGEIPGAQKVGYLWRFRRSALENWFNSGLSSGPTEETQ